MFKTELSWDDDQRRQREILATRIYLLLLIVSVIILVIYTFIDTQTKLVTIVNPSQQQFDQLRLHPRSSPTLDCPCQNIIVSYQSFISIKPHYHQLCSSDFVATNSTWLSLLYSQTATTNYSYDDYRIFVVPQFRLLSSLCSLANNTITESILEFSRNVMITERVQSRETIKSQANSILNQFLLSTPRTFVRTLDFIRSMAQGNGIVSSILSNWHFLSADDIFEWAALWGVPRSYGNNSCSCGTNAMCISEAAFDGFIVPGFHVGCYPLEALLQSTLECLYDISCIDQLKSMYNQTNLTFNALDSSLSSPNSTVQTLVDALLVEKWETNVTYDQYYTTCIPLSCTYTYNGDISLIYTITTIIGFYGGLSVMLKLLAPVLVKIGYYIVSYRHRRVQPATTVSTIANTVKL
jgi:hypothetical protein